MAAVTAKMVKDLREMTGAGMMDCKKALSATDGDMDKAVEFLMDLFTFFLAVPDMDDMSLPSKRTAPSPGVSMPFKIRNRVVFPAPDGPITETNSP